MVSSRDGHPFPICRAQAGEECRLIFGAGQGVVLPLNQENGHRDLLGVELVPLMASAPIDSDGIRSESLFHIGVDRNLGDRPRHDEVTGSIFSGIDPAEWLVGILLGRTLKIGGNRVPEQDDHRNQVGPPLDREL